MSAYIRIIREEDLPIIRDYLDREGVVLISPSVAQTIEKRLGRSIDGEILDGYNFGGEADISIDFVASPSHFVVEYIKRLGKENV
uniref:hypothetical protein n=1 Tax=Candidatus Fimivicinus sp. TaxID=3056640 RepID=UPI004026CB10